MSGAVNGVCGVQRLVNVVKLMLLEKCCDMIRVKFGVEVAHDDELFLCHDAGRDELGEVLKEKISRTLSDIRLHKKPVVLGV